MALVCDAYCEFVIFPFGILGQVWYLIVSIPDPCCLSYFMMDIDIEGYSFSLMCWIFAMEMCIFYT